MPEKTIQSLEELTTLVEEVLSVIPRREGAAAVLALHGELGAGKTAFVQALGNVLGVTEHITSPTFVIMKRYRATAHDFFTTLVHIDAYRIEDPKELIPLKLAEVLREPRTFVAIEWAERIADLLPADALHITFTHTDENTRVVSY